MDALASYETAIERGQIPAVAQARGAFDLKGVTTSLTVLRLRTRDLGHIERQLRVKVTQFPQFFQDAPTVIDMGGLDGSTEGIPLSAVAHLLRACKVLPVGVINIGEIHRDEALAAGLGILRSKPDGKPAPEADLEAQGDERSDAAAAHAAAGAAHAAAPTAAAPAPAPAPAAEPPPAPQKHRPPVVVRTPVRSGQVIYAEATDIIALGPVNPGAQLVADGHIHVYAPLRGRALAGARGYTDARIFCHRLEAELLSIAGAYVMADDIPRERWGKSVQVYVEHGECRITPL
jgi:septum site-determining protein MinC